MGSNNQGVYICANDAVMPWASAFFESFRHYNPDLPLLLMPFDDRCDKLIALGEKFGATVHTDPTFEALEELGRSIGQGIVPHGHHWFRRFAAFWGPLENFLYLDTDIVVLSDLSPMLKAQRNSDFDLLHFDVVLDQVYNPGEFRKRMVRNGARGFNSGTWGSQRGVFTLEELQKYEQEAQPVLHHLNTRNSDQCFLNFIADTKGIKYANFAEVMDNVSPYTWARTSNVYCSNDRYYRWDHGGIEHNKRMTMLHWAGVKPTPAMPNLSVFLRFALAHLKEPARSLAAASWRLQSLVRGSLDRIHRNRHINIAYHSLRNRVGGHELPERLRAMRQQPTA